MLSFWLREFSQLHRQRAYKPANNHFLEAIKWDTVFKSGPSKIFVRQPLKNLNSLSRPYRFKFFKGWLPQSLLSPLLNTLSQMHFVHLRYPYRYNILSIVLSMVCVQFQPGAIYNYWISVNEETISLKQIQQMCKFALMWKPGVFIVYH